MMGPSAPPHPSSNHESVTNIERRHTIEPSGSSNVDAITKMANGPEPRKTRIASPLVSRKRPSASKPRPSSFNPISKPSTSGQEKLSLEARRREHDGWSQPPPDGVQTFPVFTTKRALRQGYRYHIMRFVRARIMEEDKPVDPTDQEEFTRPVTLHRRDPRQPVAGRAEKPESATERQVVINNQDTEEIARAKAERDAQRVIDQSKIAPMTKDVSQTHPTTQRTNRQKDEKTMINRAPKTEQGKKESDLRYEEALPWHLEDADSKNIWVGNYISALSEANPAVAMVAFVIDRPGFRMIPLEKWYKFTAKPPFKPFSLDEAEALMSQKTDIGRWAMRDQEKKEAKKELTQTRTFLRGPAPVKKESSTFRSAPRAERLEHDEMDISGDEFQDDDEAPALELVDNDDERDVKARVRRDQLGANLYGAGDEQEVDREEQEQMREKQDLKTFGKKLKRALVRREHDIRYQSDSSANDPFESSSDDDNLSSEDAKPENLGQNASNVPAINVAAAEKTSLKPAPLTTKPKPSEKSLKATTRKRPGSPTLSESSGNESSRKKPKAGHTQENAIMMHVPTPSTLESSHDGINAGIVPIYFIK
jgi:transcription initiation factor TFIIF subunit alpha